jgi:hypothetical protein
MKFRPSVVIGAVTLLSLLSMSSCIKSYTCHCNITYTGTPGLPDTTTQEYTIKDTQSGAKSKCAAQSGTYQKTTDPEQGQVTTTESCYLY